MEKKFINETHKTPSINFEPNKGLIQIKGRSIPENAMKTFEPLVDKWIPDYLSNPASTTILDVELEFYNTSTSMWLLRLFKQLEDLYKTQQNVVINWYYSDDDMLESAEDYEEIIAIPFNKIELDEE